MKNVVNYLTPPPDDKGLSLIGNIFIFLVMALALVAFIPYVILSHVYDSIFNKQ